MNSADQNTPDDLSHALRKLVEALELAEQNGETRTRTGLAAIAGHLRQIGNLARAAGKSGLHSACAIFDAAIEHALISLRDDGTPEFNSVDAWQVLFRVYLEFGERQESLDAFLRHIEVAGLAGSMPREVADQAMSAIRSVPVTRSRTDAGTERIPDRDRAVNAGGSVGEDANSISGPLEPMCTTPVDEFAQTHELNLAQFQDGSGDLNPAAEDEKEPNDHLGLHERLIESTHREPLFNGDSTLGPDEPNLDSASRIERASTEPEEQPSLKRRLLDGLFTWMGFAAKSPATPEGGHDIEEANGTGDTAAPIQSGVPFDPKDQLSGQVSDVVDDDVRGEADERNSFGSRSIARPEGSGDMDLNTSPLQSSALLDSDPDQPTLTGIESESGTFDNLSDHISAARSVVTANAEQGETGVPPDEMSEQPTLTGLESATETFDDLLERPPATTNNGAANTEHGGSMDSPDPMSEQPTLTGFERTGEAFDHLAPVHSAASEESAGYRDDGGSRASLVPISEQPTLTGIEGAAPSDDNVFDALGSSGPDGDHPQRNSGLAAANDSTALPYGVRELIELLRAELPELHSTLDNTFAVASVDEMDQTMRQQAIEGIAEQISRFGGAAQAVGLLGLNRVCTQVHTNLSRLAERTRALMPEEAALLNGWLEFVSAYLAAPADVGTHSALAFSLVDQRWPEPVSRHTAGEIQAALADVLTLEPEDEGPSRPQSASEVDLSIEIPADVNPESLDGLLQELPGQSEEFSAAIQRMLAGGTLEDVNIAQRIAHTIKGAGNTVGVRGIANLTHYLEDILLALSRTQMLPSKRLGDSLMLAADCLETMTETLLAGGGQTPADAHDVVQNILDWANHIDKEGLPTDDSGPSRLAGAEQVVDGRPIHPKARPALHESHDKDATPQTPTIRVPATLVDELLRLVGETIILTGQVRERLTRAEGQTRAMREHFRLLQELGAELEQFIDLTDLSARKQRVMSFGGFDTLEMDQYSELHTYSRRLAEAATDAAEMGGNLVSHLSELSNMLASQERLNGDTQEAVMRTRMVPVKTVFPRLQRSVRQACRLIGKEVDLNLGGGETLMDSDVLNAMVDSIMHLLRNCVDHGIEESTERLAAGKPRNGKINLDFMRDGNNILIRCSDDGQGLDLPAIRERAFEQGLLSGKKITDDAELKRLVLLPNFSTRKKVTQTSGRGIGLDAVNTRVNELGGSLALDSRDGKGCTVDVRLPVSLISTHALLVRVGPQLMAVSSRGISQILHSSAGELRDTGDATEFRLDGDSHPVRELETLLGFATDRRSGRKRAGRPLLMVDTGIGTTIVMVQSVLESRELVIKSFGRYVRKVRGVIGATILGDGSVTPVLDLPELLRTPASVATQTATNIERTAILPPKLPRALVVDDSLTARRALAQFMQDSGFDVRTARDGIEAMEIIQGSRPDILLVDLEMPRMNGIELTTYVRGVPEMSGVPIIMVTSRSTSRHREQATAAGVNVYLTKPFSDDELLDHIKELSPHHLS